MIFMSNIWSLISCRRSLYSAIPYNYIIKLLGCLFKLSVLISSATSRDPIKLGITKHIKRKILYKLPFIDLLSYSSVFPLWEIIGREILLPLAVNDQILTF